MVKVSLETAPFGIEHASLLILPDWDTVDEIAQTDLIEVMGNQFQIAPEKLTSGPHRCVLTDLTITTPFEQARRVHVPGLTSALVLSASDAQGHVAAKVPEPALYRVSVLGAAGAPAPLAPVTMFGEFTFEAKADRDGLLFMLENPEGCLETTAGLHLAIERIGA